MNDILPYERTKLSISAEFEKRIIPALQKHSCYPSLGLVTEQGKFLYCEG